MAKTRKKSSRRAHARRRSNPKRRSSYALTRRNPISDVIPFNSGELASMLAGTLLGGIITTVAPGKFAPSLTGVSEYAVDALIAVLGAFGLKKFAGAPNLAKGWLLGGALATAENIIADYTQRQVVTFSNPLNAGATAPGMSSFYAGGKRFVLPRDPGVFFNKAPLPMALPAAKGSKSAMPVKGMGYAANYGMGYFS